MEPATVVFGVSFRKKPRIGQMAVFKALETHRQSLNVKLPTGYGKTLTACGVYSILQKQKRVTRLLIIFPTDAQLEQFVKDGPKDLADADVDGPRQIIDVRFFGAEAIGKHRNNTAQVYAITIHSLIQARGMDNIHRLLQTGLWMIVVDEYHHYGVEKTWGKTVLALQRSFLLAMSATPSRRYNDSAFGVPDIIVTYDEAVAERAVKPLKGHSYNYKIDALTEEGDVLTFTTNELAEAAGGDDPEKIEKFRIERRMRWSPKYVNPLVTKPIERMLRKRMETGHRLQALVGAMCVSHAELVCTQLKAWVPDLKIDWVGTGTNGRSAKENTEILNRFCPPKDDDGRRKDHTLDVLVHVGMAGEGLDTIYVSEVVHLTNASICNRSNQINGRAARFLEGVTGYINFDSSSEYAKYIGGAIMAAMDEELPPEKAPDDDDDDTDGPRPIPEEPVIQIWNMELIGIDTGSPEIQLMADVLQQSNVVLGVDYKILKADRQHPGWEQVIDLYRMMRTREAEAFNEESRIRQWQDSVANALSVVTGRIIRKLMPNGMVEKSIPGDIKRKINQRKKSLFGQIGPNIEICRQHYKWLQELDREIIERGVPSWLS